MHAQTLLHFSHLYIIVIINSSAITNARNMTTQQLIEYSQNDPMIIYIAAVVNSSEYEDDHRMKYVLGAGDSTTDASGVVFHNREVKGEYLFFYRVFSADSTSEVAVVLIKPTRANL